ncbi:hypothetical protein RUM43_001097 [Polyplax serrata]|uniref:Uncharacterized protein n=1 Tax=Polyplax serrata TaxID=468196 RepID=A0AAN8SEU0_POLSC
MMYGYLSLVVVLSVFPGIRTQEDDTEDDFPVPDYIYQCRRDDPDINGCLTHAANHLANHFKDGIPELGVPGVEPISIDEIQIALGSGPDGYRAIFRDIDAYGVSNLTVTGVRTDLDTLQFQISFFIPKITAEAKYRSSGVLIMVKASGGGEYWGEYEGVRAKVYFRAKAHPVGRHKYLSIEEIKMDFSVKDIKMGIKNIHNGNSVLEAALNLMINTNAQELLTEMKPSLRKELVSKMKIFTENIFARIPYDIMIIDE